MRAGLILGLLVVGACAAPPDRALEGTPIEGPGFDTVAWVAAVQAAETAAERRAVGETLLDAVDWRVACGEDDPTNPGRGTIELYPVEGDRVAADARVVADVTCRRGAVNRAFALVDLAPGRAPRLVQSFGISEAGRPTDELVPGFFGVPTYAPDGARRFEVLTPREASGGCGLFVRYALAADGGAEIAEVRLYDACAAPSPVAEWPVTFEAP